MKPEFRDKSVSIIGLGRSGVALARVLGKRGCKLLLSDGRSREELEPVLADLNGIPYQLEAGGQTERIFQGKDMVVISPGVSVHHPLIREALRVGVPVVGEVEVAWALSPKPFVAITGTNGKSTSVTLLGAMLGARGKVAGNIGNPLVGEVLSLPAEVEWVVAEISSFQLETVHGFRPRVGVLTNVTPDHLDRHPNLEEYFAAKARLFAQMGKGDKAFFGIDDPAAQRMAEMLEKGRLPEWLPGFPRARRDQLPELLHISIQGPVRNGVSLLGDEVVRFKEARGERILVWDFPNLSGPHNKANALTAIAVADALGVPASDMATALRGHQSLHYRMEPVARIGGVQFINDSKATNVASVVAALESFEPPLTLIAGGKDKGFDFAPLAQAVAHRVAYLILIGEAAARIEAEITRLGHHSLERASSLREAVRRAAEVTPSGGTVLLSPACSSFDMFKSAEDRGAQFEALVKELEEAKA